MKEKAKYTQKIQLSNCFQKILKAETFDTDMTSGQWQVKASKIFDKGGLCTSSHFKYEGNKTRETF